MFIRTRTGTHDWEVCAEWLGAIRPVFVGSIFECFAFIREAEEE